MSAFRLVLLTVTCPALAACGNLPASTASGPAADSDRHTTAATVWSAQTTGRACVGWSWTRSHRGRTSHPNRRRNLPRDDSVPSAPRRLFIDGRSGLINLQVIIDDGLQAELDQRFGPGLVRVHAHLTPVN
jgi:hypothetical protein